MSGPKIQVGGPMTIHHPSCAADRPVVISTPQTTRAFWLVAWHGFGFGFPSLFILFLFFLSIPPSISCSHYTPVDHVPSLSM